MLYVAVLFATGTTGVVLMSMGLLLEGLAVVSLGVFVAFSLSGVTVTPKEENRE